jgi:hypothetical protein
MSQNGNANGHDEKNSARLWSWSSVRLQMAFLLSFAMMTHGLMRGNFGMALVCMVPPFNVSLVEPVQYNTDLQVEWGMRTISVIHMFFYAGTFLSVFVAHLFAQMSSGADGPPLRGAVLVRP